MGWEPISWFWTVMYMYTFLDMLPPIQCWLPSCEALATILNFIMTRQGTTSQSQVGNSNHKDFELVKMWIELMFGFFSILPFYSQQSTLLTQHPPWRMNLEVLRLPFSQSVTVRVFFLTCMCASVYIPAYHLGNGLHLEFFIGHPIFPKSGLNRVFVAYFLYHYLETVAMNIDRNGTHLKKWFPLWISTAHFFF